MKTTQTLFSTVLLLLVSSANSADPETLIKLRANYDGAVARALAPLQRTYAAELEKLKVEYTKAGKLEEALAVSDELKKLTSSSSPSDQRAIGAPAPPSRLRSFKTVDDFTTWLSGTVWTNDDGEIVAFGDNDFGVHWKDNPPLAPDTRLGRYPTTPGEIGELNFRFPQGGNVVIRISDDLKTCKIGQKKEFRQVPADSVPNVKFTE